jgi:hypothetical protein
LFDGMGIYDALAFVSYGLIAVSYAMRDIKWLRVITVFACTVDIVVYYFIRPGQPLWVQLCMSVLFVVINLYQLYVLWKESRGHAFEGEVGDLYRSTFSILAPGEFRKLLLLGQWQTLEVNTPVLNKGKPVASVTFVVAGHLDVRLGDATLNSIRAGGMAGEMSYLTGKPATADVIAAESTRAFVITHQTLEQLKTKNPELHTKVNYVIGREVAEKLSHTNQQWLESRLE